jgi:oxygen-independent coproporphyrinogen-3 oxidase
MPIEAGLNRAEAATQRRLAEVIWNQARPINIQEVARSAEKGRRLNLYLHIGFCESQCTFCGYRIEAGPAPEVVDNYVTSLSNQITQTLPHFISERTRIGQIYIGGGTPSILSGSQIERLIAVLGQNIDIKQATTTFEMHPKHVTPELIRLLINLGVSRFSVGVQSLDMGERKVMGRAGTSVEEDSRAILLLKEAGLPFNVDLMYGTPGHTLAVWERTLGGLIALNPPEVTLYQFIQAAESKLGKMLNEGKLTKPGVGTRWKMYAMARERFLAAGYFQDNAFGFSKIDDFARSQHLSPDYFLGFGPGAYSKIGPTFFVNTASVAEYANGAADSYWGITIPKWLNRAMSGLGDTAIGRG